MGAAAGTGRLRQRGAGKINDKRCDVWRVRHERDGVDDEARRRIRLILPHIRRAVLIGRLAKLKQAEAASFADILDGPSSGMFLVDGRGAIVHVNRAGKAFLDDGDGLGSNRGRLAARDPHIDRALRDVYAAANLGDAATRTRLPPAVRLT